MRSRLLGVVRNLFLIAITTVMSVCEAATIYFSGPAGSTVGIWQWQNGTSTRISDGTESRGVAVGQNGLIYSNIVNGVQTDVKQFDRTLTNQAGTLFNIGGPTLGGFGLTFGADGNLYVSDGTNDYIQRYNGTTGLFAGSLGSGLPAPFDNPDQITSDVNNTLFVRARDTRTFVPTILRIDGTTGAFIDEFIPNGTAGLRGPTDLTIGPDQQLYVTDFSTESVYKFDSQTGDFLGIAATGMFTTLRSLDFGPDGYLYVADANLVRKIDITTNTLLDTYNIGTAAGDIQVVPIPPAVWLFGSGLLGLIGIARRKKAVTQAAWLQYARRTL